MFPGRTLLLLCLGLRIVCVSDYSFGHGCRFTEACYRFPLPVDGYHDQQIPSLFGKLTGRIQREFPIFKLAMGGLYRPAPALTRMNWRSRD
jgi:hypothetical protein